MLVVANEYIQSALCDQTWTVLSKDSTNDTQKVLQYYIHLNYAITFFEYSTLSTRACSIILFDTVRLYSAFRERGLQGPMYNLGTNV